MQLMNEITVQEPTDDKIHGRTSGDRIDVEFSYSCLYLKTQLYLNRNYTETETQREQNEIK